MAEPWPMPPATNTGTSVTLGNISCARTPVEPGPICPPASMPSMTMASAPARMSFLAIASAGAKHTSFAPDCLMRETAGAGGNPPASTTWPTLRLVQTSTSAIRSGWSVIRLTPKGLLVSSLVATISSSKSLGVIEPQAMTPKPPPLEMAATRLRSDTQVMAPPMMASSLPRNPRPRAHSRASQRRPGPWLAVVMRIPLSSGVQPIGGVQRAYRELRVLFGYQHAHLDLGGRDHLDVDVLGRQGRKHLLRDAGVAAHADADDRDLDHVRIGLELGVAERLLLRLERLHRARQVRFGDGEGQIGGLPVLGDVLHDHVDVDRMLGQRPEDGRGHARPVGNRDQRHLGVVAAVGDAAHHLFFHDLVLVNHQCTRNVLIARQNLHAHAAVHRQFDRTRLQDLGPLAGEFEHLLIGYSIELPRLRNDARIGGIDPVDVGEDVATFGLERRRQRHRRGVGTAAPQRGDAAVRPDALEARQHRDLAPLHGVGYGLDRDVDNPRLAVDGVGLDRNLPAEPGTRLEAERLQRQRQEAGGDLLARGHHHVVFAAVLDAEPGIRKRGGIGVLGLRLRRRFGRPADQLVGDAGHGGDDHRHLIAGIDLALDALRHAADPVDAGDRGAAEFLYNARHLLSLRRLRIKTSKDEVVRRQLCCRGKGAYTYSPPCGRGKNGGPRGGGMSGAGLAVPAAALALTLAASNPDGAALTQLGLSGNWAVDCQKAISDDNPHVTFATPGDQYPEYIERDPGGMQGAAAVSNVHTLQGGQIAMILTVTSNFGGRATQIVMNNVLVKDGDKFRFLEIKSDSGQTVVSGGIVKANGQPTKWLQKCGG